MHLHLKYLATFCSFLVFYTSLGASQQSYIGDPQEACASDSYAPTSLGYDCNGLTRCGSILTIRSQFPYNTLREIADLLAIDIKDIALANPEHYNDDVIEQGKLILAPTACACDYDHAHYLKSTTRTVGLDDSYYHMANELYQGLTTCPAIKAVNYLNSGNLAVGTNLDIPIRCACPTLSQQEAGIGSIISYVVGNGESFSSISARFGVDSKSLIEANRLLENSTIYPGTTLLVPVGDKSNLPSFLISAGSDSSEAGEDDFWKGKTGRIVAAALVVILVLFGIAGATWNLQIRTNVIFVDNISIGTISRRTP